MTVVIIKMKNENWEARLQVRHRGSRGAYQGVQVLDTIPRFLLQVLDTIPRFLFQAPLRRPWQAFMLWGPHFLALLDLQFSQFLVMVPWWAVRSKTLFLNSCFLYVKGICLTARRIFRFYYHYCHSRCRCRSRCICSLSPQTLVQVQYQVIVTVFAPKSKGLY